MRRPRLEIKRGSKVFATTPDDTDNDPRMQVNLTQEFDGEVVALAHGDIARVHKFLGKVLEYNAQVKPKRKGGGGRDRQA